MKTEVKYQKIAFGLDFEVNFSNIKWKLNEVQKKMLNSMTNVRHENIFTQTIELVASPVPNCTMNVKLIGSRLSVIKFN